MLRVSMKRCVGQMDQRTLAIAQLGGVIVEIVVVKRAAEGSWVLHRPRRMNTIRASAPRFLLSVSSRLSVNTSAWIGENIAAWRCSYRCAGATFEAECIGEYGAFDERRVQGCWSDFFERLETVELADWRLSIGPFSCSDQAHRRRSSFSAEIGLDFIAKAAGDRPAPRRARRTSPKRPLSSGRIGRIGEAGIEPRRPRGLKIPPRFGKR